MRTMVVGLCGLMLLSAWGCSHAPVQGKADPKTLFAQACAPGVAIRSVQGSVWLKAKSKEASGQFPALIHAPSPEKLKMEVTNLVGGTEAVISIDGGTYLIEVPNRKDRTQKGEYSWGGIPLQWANALFLGRIPCPEGAARDGASLSTDAEGNLIVQAAKTLDRMPERFVYRFRSLEGAVWPEALHWERQGPGGSAPLIVDFKFEDPEAKTLSPKKWEAKGPQGEVKVRWRDRQVEMTSR